MLLRPLAFLLLLAASSAMGRAANPKPGPAGIYALLPSFNSERPVDLARPVWSNPLIRGVTVRTVWRNVNPEASRLDWSYFDTAAATAARNGKSAGLSLAAGIFTPAWVYRAGAAPFNFTLSGPWIPTRPMTMPEPWDPAFLGQWGAIILAMGRRYDANPAVAYVMIGGLGFSIESVYAKNPADIAQLQALGGAVRWLQGAERIVDLYAQAFPTTPFIYAMAPPVKGDFAPTRALVEYGMAKYPHRFGIMYHGLNAAADPAFYPDHAVQTCSPQAPAGFQMVWSTDGGEGAKRVKGTLAQALARGAQLGAHFIEVYESDCQNPAQVPALSAAAAALASQAHP